MTSVARLNWLFAIGIHALWPLMISPGRKIKGARRHGLWYCFSSWKPSTKGARGRDWQDSVSLWGGDRLKFLHLEHCFTVWVLAFTKCSILSPLTPCSSTMLRVHVQLLDCFSSIAPDFFRHQNVSDWTRLTFKTNSKKGSLRKTASSSHVRRRLLPAILRARSQVTH